MSNSNDVRQEGEYIVGKVNMEIPRVVVCAAIKNKRGVMVCSPRHWDTMMHAQALSMKGEDWYQAEQGFVDQRGVWLTREEAWKVAEAAGQIMRRVGGDEGCLYSENLY